MTAHLRILGTAEGYTDMGDGTAVRAVGDLPAALAEARAAGIRVLEYMPNRPGAAAVWDAVLASRDPDLVASDAAEAWLDANANERVPLDQLDARVARHVLDQARRAGKLSVPARIDRKPPSPPPSGPAVRTMSGALLDVPDEDPDEDLVELDAADLEEVAWSPLAVTLVSGAAVATAAGAAILGALWATGALP